MGKLKTLIHQFLIINLAFLFINLFIRVFENFTVAIKFFNIKHPYLYEIYGLFYDFWTWLFYSAILLLVFIPLYFLNKRLSIITLHVLNSVSIAFYYSFVVVFSERTMPFDHELFTREIYESVKTTQNFITSNILFLSILIVLIASYHFVYHFYFKKIKIHSKILVTYFVLILLGTSFIKYAMPKSTWFNQVMSYYLTSNKAMYWAVDSYTYFTTIDAFEGDGSAANIQKEVNFYQQSQTFKFISKEFPLLHEDLSKDVLGGFFNLSSTPPNIVLLVIESMSGKYCGKTAKPASFTPFLDSLADKSLCWDNMLSCATGSFGVYPAMTTSCPYGKNGFSLMTVLPDHNSLVKILKNNGYYSYFMTGFDLDYYNLGSFMRQQGTDFILTNYGKKYKQMGIGPDGWSEGYPDKDLFNRSFEVLDSLPHTPYLNAYFTLTTHEPYIFDAAPFYEKKFQKKMETLNISSDAKKSLNVCRKFLRTVMYTDDCLRDFFDDYKKRKEYANTIFIVTGDHHSGNFPTEYEIDGYHVPLIIYSPMLKKAMRSQAINSHNNIGPSILALLNHNFKLKQMPSEVHWVADVLDTCKTFRCIQNIPLMLYSREIDEYISNDNYVNKQGLYKIRPGLKLEPNDDPDLKAKILRLRDNYKFINSYVCSKNKICPPNLAGKKGKQTLLFTYPVGIDSIKSKKEQLFVTPRYERRNILDDIIISKKYKKIFIELSLETLTDHAEPDFAPQLSLDFMAIESGKPKILFYCHKSFIDMTESGYKAKMWNTSVMSDLYDINTFNKGQDIKLTLTFYSDLFQTKVKLKNFKIKIYGIE